jgi:hypothetical protein
MTDSLLRQDLLRLLEGKNAHAPMEDVLRGVSPALRLVRPDRSLHSVWEQIEHMRLAQEDILHYTLDRDWISPEWPSGYWPERPRTLSPARWKASVVGFSRDLEKVKAVVRNRRIDLTSTIPHAGVTYLREILLIADHNAYHAGQIVQIRKLLGDWR